MEFPPPFIIPGLQGISIYQIGSYTPCTDCGETSETMHLIDLTGSMSRSCEGVSGTYHISDTMSKAKRQRNTLETLQNPVLCEDCFQAIECHFKKLP